ncbi:hypothetical protein KD050_02840 [Psychrobacillus sp. INOP01]|uniref:hypothetical protein n=1 Tax=Psychrobacillus sp. INOP01 TaxID=2829187 RepID=UPI001BABE26D|nr:hypothetical protein [Psychrobacillus sp. INOP01]QUG42248.1 hypothetical protein KD050_02840 [Psychrobacillus sp. INOP01]
MLFSILLIVSVLITLLLVYFIRLSFEKKPIYIVILISGITVLFSYITSQNLSLWLGILFFFGIIVSSAILLGKRKEWLVKKEEIGQAQVPNRNLHRVKKHFENSQGRSIYDEEKSPLYIPKEINEVDSIIEESSFEDFLLNKQEVDLATLENKQNELDPLVELPVSEIIIPIDDLEEIVAPVVPDPSYEAALQEAAMTEINMELNDNSKEKLGLTVNNETEQIEDAEELSDKWMARRFDALLGSEENPLQKSFQEPDPEEIIRPNLDDLSTSIQETKEKFDKRNDFEDISAQYFNKQRSDLDGTKE